MSVASRRLAEEQALREAHYARFGFRVGEVVTLPWCGLCGKYDHFGQIDSLRMVGSHMTADAYLACQRRVVAVDCRLLAHPKGLSEEMRLMLLTRAAE